MKYRRFTPDFKRSIVEQLLSETALYKILCVTKKAEPFLTPLIIDGSGYKVFHYDGVWPITHGSANQKT